MPIGTRLPGGQALRHADALLQHDGGVALGPRHALEARLADARVGVDQAGSDLRAPDVDADRARHGR